MSSDLLMLKKQEREIEDTLDVIYDKIRVLEDDSDVLRVELREIASEIRRLEDGANSDG